MRKKSEEAGFVRVADLQQTHDSPSEPEFARLIEEVAGHLVECEKYASVGAAIDNAMPRKDYYAAINDDASLARESIGALIELVDDPLWRRHFAERAWDTFLMRRARRQRSFLPVYDLSPYEIWGRAITFKSVSDPNDKNAMQQDYWRFLLYRTMHALDQPLTAVNASNVGELTETLVDIPRVRYGEAVALKHAMILLYAYRYNQSFAERDLIPLLTMIFVVIDLAAQLNDMFLEKQLVELLKDDLKNQLSGPASGICDRMILTTESTIIRHSLHFRPRSPAALDSHHKTLQGLSQLETATNELGFIAEHPRIGVPWLSACFQGVQTSLAAGLPRSEIDQYVALHEKTGSKFKDIMPGFRSMKEALGINACRYLSSRPAG